MCERLEPMVPNYDDLFDRNSEDVWIKDLIEVELEFIGYNDDDVVQDNAEYDQVDFERAMLVPDTQKFIDDLLCHGKTILDGERRSVGIYWTWDRLSAIPYLGEKGEEILLEAVIDPRDINIDKTFDVGLTISGEQDIRSSEKEIRMFKGSKILLKSVCHMHSTIPDKVIYCKDLNILITV